VKGGTTPGTRFPLQLAGLSVSSETSQAARESALKASLGSLGRIVPLPERTGRWSNFATTRRQKHLGKEDSL